MSFRNISKIIAITAAFIIPVTAYTAGPVMVEFHHTVEEARINVVSNADNSNGKVTATLFECNGCIPEVYSFNGSTVLINQFGAKRPISDLKKWSGSRAMFHYRIADKSIEQLKILP